MSIADELGVFLFPDDVPVNLSNNKDLKILKTLFPKKDIYIVVGSDVLINATAYNLSLIHISLKPMHQY